MTKEQIAIIKKARSECHAGMGATAAATLYSLLLDVEKQEQGEPVAWIHEDERIGYRALEWKENVLGYRGVWKKIPLYTTPQQRKPLTDEERATIEAQHTFPPMSDSYQYWFFKGVDAAEAAHGIKENT